MTRSAGLVFVASVVAGALVACGPEPAPIVVPPPPSASASALPTADVDAPEDTTPVPQPPACSADGYCWMSPFPGAGLVRAVWSAGERDIYALMTPERLMHFDGSTWRAERVPNVDSLACLGGSGPDDVLAAGGSGAVVRREKGVWRAIPGAGDTPFQAVWGSPTGDIFAAGAGADTIAHHDGREWHAEPLGAKASLSALWGLTSADLYAVGADDTGGFVAHRDAAGWKALPKVGKSLIGVWGTGPDAVWVAGTDDREKPAVWRWSGSQWRPEDVSVGGEARSFSGVGATPVLLGVEYLDSQREAMGPTSVFTARLDGGKWAKSEVLLASPLLFGGSYLVHGDARGSLLLAGGWGVVGAIETGGLRGLSGNAALGKSLTGVWGTSPSDVVAVGAEGALLRYDGKVWSADPAGKGLSFTSIHGAKDILVASALGGKVLVRKDRVWTPLATGTTKDLFAVWTDGDEIFAAGDEGIVVRCAKERCSKLNTGTEDALHSLAGRGPKDLYAASDGATLLRFDGKTWRNVKGPGEPGVEVIDPDKGKGPRHDEWVMHIGAIAPDPRGGMIIERTDGTYHIEGNRWTRTAGGGGFAIATASNGDTRVVYGGSAEGTPMRVRRFDGESWHDEALPVQDLDASNQRVRAIWSGGGEVFVVGDGGTILRRAP